jgi:hypothetical protein
MKILEIAYLSFALIVGSIGFVIGAVIGLFKLGICAGMELVDDPDTLKNWFNKKK